MQYTTQKPSRRWALVFFALAIVAAVSWLRIPHGNTELDADESNARIARLRESSTTALETSSEQPEPKQPQIVSGNIKMGMVVTPRVIIQEEEEEEELLFVSP